MTFRKGKLVLASSSPRRRAILAEMGYQFDVVAPHVDETLPPDLPPQRRAERVAVRKAEAVAPDAAEEGAWVLAADTLVACDGRPIGKAADESQAREFLRLLTSRCHAVITGLCVINTATGERRVAHDTTWLRMRPMSEAELNAYIASAGWRDKAGAYALQEGGDPFVEEMDGSLSNVVGLPKEVVSDLVPMSFHEYLDFLHRDVIARHRDLLLVPEDLGEGDVLERSFGRSEAPLEVEIGPGKDVFVIRAAEDRPETNFLAIERIRKRVDKLCAKIKRAEVANVRVFYGDASDALDRLLRPGQVRAFTINFPDPWPKRRHAKHRLMQSDVAARLAECLEPDGRLTVVTDVRPYAEQILKVVESAPGLVNLNGPRQWLTELPGYHQSVFERKRRAAGATIHYMQFDKQTSPANAGGEDGGSS